MKLLVMPRRAEGGVLPQVWATEGNLAQAVYTMEASASAGSPEVTATGREPGFRVVITRETAFYRKYTEALLRRYAVMALQKGRVPSLLGRELFRGKVTSYRMHSFDDAVHFTIDVERCMKLLDADGQRLVYRIAVQEYTFAETAGMLCWSLRSTRRRYNEALDELTAILQKRGLMEKVPGMAMPKPCQEGEAAGVEVSYTPPMTSA